ncbi:hypothetical protein [Bacillus cereus]|uniref:hypothetical protein n=1 Tax=Bacillus cereus TaxID=1396 RepID=UPI000B4B1BD3|nr:hypothetical protein [Bacillus cereus]
MQKVYYHITTDLEHTGYFEPRIPENAFDFESKTFNRICVSDSIEGCFNAVPCLDEFSADGIGYFKVFEIVPEELGLTDNDIVGPEYLYKNENMHDALITNEHWITKPFQVPKEKQTVCKMSFFEETSRVIIPFTLAEQIKKDFTKEIVMYKKERLLATEETISYTDIFMFYEEELADRKLYEKSLFSVPAVYDLEFYREKSEDAQELWFSGEQLTDVLEYVQFNFPDLTVNKECEQEFSIVIPAHTNVKSIFLYDYKNNKKALDNLCA